MKSLFHFIQQAWRCSSGNALLETTIILPLMISLMAGGVDFGFALSTQATASKSIRNAARYLASVPPSAVCTWGIANARKLAVYGKLNANIMVDQPMISGWSMDAGQENNVQLGPNTNCANPIVIQLQAKVPHQTFFLIAIFPNAGTLVLSAQHEERSIGG